MRRVLLFLLFLFPLAVSGQEYGKWRNANDKWYTDDKGFHMMGSYVLCHVLDHKMRLDAAILLTWTAGLLWEVKDAYIPCEKVFYFGGDGFSRYDLMADYAGTYLYVLVNYVLFPKNRKLKASLWQRDGTSYLSLSYSW